MAVARARYSKVARVVDGLLATVPGQIPVPVETIVSNHGIILRKGDLGEVSGLLVRLQDGATIGINANQSRLRQRFTIAHEFGHFLLHEGIREHVDRVYRVNFRDENSSQATNVEEVEANFFAASLLMPEAVLLERRAVEALDDDGQVRQLAKVFDVSQHAMSLRLANLYRRHAPY